jgi:hypothetical protein
MNPQCILNSYIGREKFDSWGISSSLSRYHRRFSQSAQNRFFFVFSVAWTAIESRSFTGRLKRPINLCLPLIQTEPFESLSCGSVACPVRVLTGVVHLYPPVGVAQLSRAHPRMWYPILRFPNQIRISLLTRRILASFYEQFSTSVCWACRACAAS